MSVLDSAALLDPHAAAVLALLRADHLIAEVVLDELCSDPDVRIALNPGSDVRVELLCPGAGPSTPWWHAVREERGEREVWRGPAIGSGAASVQAFLRDLLRLAPDVLADRYRRLG